MDYQACECIRSALGIDLQPKTFTLLQMGLRAIVIYIAGLLMVRLAEDRRFGN
ncbi:hypothetical protein G7B40_024435 [Aetokthonos hydrillicola Thurmond2011]|jgi:hypothetical protein|uniref:Uncharacterized protein n=1 Tax=Aetokthonos hydrillicola Thurmond2011 TaxID=2712845 RepID=A0AAP5IA59_9CYAN|nr:hypothetical protein [Aetokthonos hydrillicola]MBW4586084.1 hypothetical protein [Aetokthonos hydrillicola CCALA 1050]MDR9897691.1 hypothetical protein [Aetokthonos hydrillicola Thurmond2011]